MGEKLQILISAPRIVSEPAIEEEEGGVAITAANHRQPSEPEESKFGPKKEEHSLRKRIERTIALVSIFT